MPTTYRLLVTGSRDWPEWASSLIEADLGYYRALWGEIVVVHGDCPSRWITQPDGSKVYVRGADRIAKDWCTTTGVAQEPHPADWKQHGPKLAGFIRNGEMADLGAFVCLGFTVTYPATKGTNDMLKKANAAGINCRVRYLAQPR